MIAWNEIEQVGRDIGQIAHAERVILFGSHARGQASEDSDLDILVVAESDQPRHKRSRELYRRVRPHHCALDILVFTPAEVAHAMRTDVSFISQAMNEGKTLYVRGN
jgi:predicted nucleotidyltransferase